jgi:hypothetical protein
MRYHIDSIPFSSGEYATYSAYEIAKLDPEYIIKSYYITPRYPITESLYTECLNNYYYRNDPDICNNCG